MATQVGTARDVFDHHVQALVKGDLDDILSDYTEDSVVIGPDGVVKGRQAT
jgi:ketosteroid isomerase-like protein